MKSVEQELKQALLDALEKAFSLSLPAEEIHFSTPPKPEQGDLAYAPFKAAKSCGKPPHEVAKALADTLNSAPKCPWLDRAEAAGPYLNLFLERQKVATTLLEQLLQDVPLPEVSQKERIVLEYSSPNTNKPLHLGHVRNGVLGMSLARLREALGSEVILVNLVNDRGIHICKSMVAYKKWGEGKTPQEVGQKGDHFVGYYYVLFDQKLKEERNAFWKEQNYPFSTARLSDREWAELIREKQLVDDVSLQECLDEGKAPLDKCLLERGVIDKKKRRELLKIKREEERRREVQLQEWEAQFLDQSKLMGEARELLRLWEEGDKDVRALWHQMNQWVYEGFRETYARLDFHFHHWDYESETYQLGKELVQKHLGKGVFYQKEDGSIWAKLEGERKGIPLKDKLVLRRDGTSVYITQDLGTALMRYERWQPDRMVYVVASEQNLHFAMLFEILERLGFSWAKRCIHASYGMVVLPQGRGKLKSREGTAVDADHLLDELEERVRTKILEGGYYETEEDIDQNSRAVALGALKFFLLKVQPIKDVPFDPDQAIQFQGDTGPYIQYSHARICSILRKASGDLKRQLEQQLWQKGTAQHPLEWQLVRLLSQYTGTVEKAANEWNPALLANYLLELAKEFSRFYTNCPVLKAPEEVTQAFRLALCQGVAKVLAHGLYLLGIPAPERM